MTALCYTTLNHSCLYGLETDLAGQARAARDAGFTLFGPDIFSLRDHLASHGTWSDLAETVADLGLGWFDLAGLTIYKDPERTEREAEELAGMAEALGLPWVQVRIPSTVSDEILGSFQRCADRFGAVGVRLGLECSPFSSSVRSMTTAHELASAITPAGLSAVIVDTWHLSRGPDTLDTLDALPLDGLAYVQFTDAQPAIGDDLAHETMERRALPGEGEIDLWAFADRLLARGFDGVVVPEVLSAELRTLDVGTFARRVFETTAPYWIRP